MVKAKKLASGNWRTQVYDYTDTDGKRYYKSFTAPTKKEAEYKAAEYMYTKKKVRMKPENITFREARERYLELKENVLSPSTIRGYHQMQSYFARLDELKMAKFDNTLLQKWINGFSQTHSAKTVKNAYGFINCVFREYSPDTIFNITLPKMVRPELRVPTDTEIASLINYLKEHDKDMLIAVYLAAFGTLRRSEVCGLTADDIQRNIIHINKTIVKDKDGNKVKRNVTKTSQSDRYIEMPQFVIDVLPKEGQIVTLTPDAITRRLQRALIKLELPYFRFHDLRHYSASIMHAIGVPDQYIMQRGGWSNDRILKDVYRGTMGDYEQKFSNLTNDYFNKMQHEMQHEN